MKQKIKPTKESLEYIETQIEQVFEEIANEVSHIDRVSKENIAFNIGRLYSIQMLLSYAETKLGKLMVEFSVSIKKGVRR